MIASPLGSLDIKAMASKNSKPTSKEEASSFENEMVESEKRMKKKTKVDGREVTGQSSAQNQRADNSSKSKSEPATPKSSKSPSVTQQKNSISEKSQSPMTTPAATPMAPTEASETLLAASDMLGELQAATQALTTESPAMSPIVATQSQEGLSLEGFQAVQPQLMVESAESEESSVQKVMQQIESLTQGVAVATDKAPADMSSENSEQNPSGFEMSSDFSAVQNLGTKEAATSNQVFATVLENKSQNLETVKQSNVENLVTQASAILKDGGGEMKLQLRPEGLGTVDLRVGLQNGQVSIEIMTQDQNIKKMFEDSLFDIRGALENQNLKIDTFHVGVSENFDQSLTQQNMSQFAEREFARDFMGQFREDRQALRNQGLDSMITNRTTANRPEGLSPASSSKNINGRLNIIA